MHETVPKFPIEATIISHPVPGIPVGRHRGIAVSYGQNDHGQVGQQIQCTICHVRVDSPLYNGHVLKSKGTGLMFRLRGHHLLCLLGYHGIGYSEEFTTNMTLLHQTLRVYPQTEILIVMGPDDLCAKYPTTQIYHCQDANIHTRDAAILAKLQLQIGEQLPWIEIHNRIARSINPIDIGSLCSTCSWRSDGVCEDGILEVQSGQGLRVIE